MCTMQTCLFDSWIILTPLTRSPHEAVVAIMADIDAENLQGAVRVERAEIECLQGATMEAGVATTEALLPLTAV